MWTNIDVPVCSSLNDYEEITYYNCEVGDLSGRFGYVQNVNNLLQVYPERISKRSCDPIITPDVVWDKSIVFHCLSGKRAFCAPFQIKVKQT